MIRDLREEELPLATGIFVESVQDLASRNGQPAPPFTVLNRLASYTHIFRTGIFKVAEVDGRVVAVSCATVRDGIWFLSGFWAATGRGLLVRQGARAAGYFYLQDGAVGPIAWLEPARGREVVELALHEAQAAGGSVRLATTALVPDAIQAALAAGLRIAGAAHLLSTRSFGRLGQYLPSGPLLF
jgi:hypothetical protein